MEYKLLLLTSGCGSRLGNITNYLNKSLVPIGKKASISHIIDKYPKNIEIVVTLGYKGNQVKNFLQLVHKDRKFVFVDVSNYDGEGSSLIFSMLHAEKYLNCPFIFQTCDTIIIDETIPEPNFNWLGISDCKNSKDYATVTATNHIIKDIHPKGQFSHDGIYIGLAGVNSYKEFFKTANDLYQKNKLNNQLSDIHIYPELIKNKHIFRDEKFYTWMDTGNIDKLQEARQFFGQDENFLEKDSESIYLYEDFVVKFFYDNNISENRIKRSKFLKNIIPDIIETTPQFYKYNFVNGTNLSDIASNKLIERLLFWADQNLWKKQNIDIKQQCYDFYITKTINRIREFFETSKISDKIDNINDIETPSVFDLLCKAEQILMSDIISSQFHGDFILDNIIYDEKRFWLLDWRQDFGGSIEVGDLYYDIAKLNHSFIFSHKIINHKNYHLDISDKIKLDIHLSNNLMMCKDKLSDFIKLKNMSQNKVDILTSIIWLNMAALHPYPLNYFLFYFGKLNLYRYLENI